jgi:hypothetical protein
MPEVIIPCEWAFQADFIAFKIGGLIPLKEKGCQAGFGGKRWALI